MKLVALGPESAAASEEKRAAELAEMIASLDKESQERVLSRLSEDDPQMAAEVERAMFSFDDLMNVGARSMQELLRNVEVPLIAMALKGATPAVEKKFADNLSARARERVREEREMAGRVPMSQVEQAREEIMDIARRMYRQGDIVVETGDEQYVE
jgi:flagellar motor switch protein FliG